MTTVSRKTAAALAAAVLAAGLLLPDGPARAQSVEAEVEAVSERFEEARSAQLDLIAPRHFQRAAERLADARDELQSGGNISEIRDRLDEARQALSRAEDLEEVGSVLLRDALAAREDALAANAPEHAPDLWEDAASTLGEAGRDVEDGDQNDAKRKAEEARQQFRAAEVRAIKTNLLGQARDERRRAREMEAHERAPRTWGDADTLLSRAETVLERDPSSQSRAGSLAEASAREFRHAARISAQADTFDRDGGIEDLMLRSEGQLARVADQLEFEPHFDEGLTPATEEILAAVRSLQEDRVSLQGELEGLRDELGVERGRVDSLEQRLAELGEQQAEVSAQLRERQRREERLREVRAVFTPQEAEVLTRGDEMIIRLVGLQFASGSAEIRPENFSLLTKLQRVIREFPDAPITVRGHTDSQGNDEYNQSLSQRRAIAVREYLLANMAMSADRVAAQGFGETQPISSNDTAEGRANNRRIDVELEIGEGQQGGQ